MKSEFRFPGPAEYSYVSLWTTEGSPFEAERELRDVSDGLLMEMGNVLHRGCAFIAVAEVGSQIVHQEQPPAPAAAPWTPDTNWANDYNAPSDPQDAYQYAPPANPYPPAPQAYQAPQGPPPGQNAPSCVHGPAKLVPAGVSKTTNKPYGAFWACQAPRGATKCVNAFPKIA